MPLQPGDKLGPYEILAPIGAGGMGEVYRARDPRLNRDVAIKVSAAQFSERFEREAKAIAALNHPNICHLYDVGPNYLVMEYIEGEAPQGPLPFEEALRIAQQIALALEEAHEKNIVHRDLKPGNIIVTPKGNAKLLDFGLSEWTAGGAERKQAAQAATTTSAAAAATVAYLSPEQALGEAGDHRTDIFSLGIILFEMLTGRLPFTATASAPIALQIVQAPAAIPSALLRSLPVELDAIVARALAKSLDQRYESVVTMAAELRGVRAILDVRSDTQEAAAVFVPARPAPRRSPVGWVLLLLVLAALGAAAWFERGTLAQFVSGR
jgi:eukaryotic-like serine/threonine-protein kinase